MAKPTPEEREVTQLLLEYLKAIVRMNSRTGMNRELTAAAQQRIADLEKELAQ